MGYSENKIPNLSESTVFCPDNGAKLHFSGMLERSVRFIERNQICDVGLWAKFVNQFRVRIDSGDLLWRCEYWGKMMRGACMILAYTEDEGFYRIVEASVRDMLSAEDGLGRFSTYTVEREFDGWDLWGRKYVMLGMQYFLEICRDKSLAEEIVAALMRHADYIVEHIGDGEAKTPICKATRHWKGLNSCSILEPMIRLYRLTGEERYLSFGEYIISTGFIDGESLIELAFEDRIPPHEYPVVKAYEMMSCFEGLLHYYRVKGGEKYRTALLNFGKRILREELSIIGCSGCTHELFDHTAVRQTQTDYKGIVQETCVTVTWMRFAEGLLELSGDPEYADAIETGFYNSYLGSFNTERVPVSHYPKSKDVPQVLPFDSYSPLTADSRGRKVGGYNVFPDGSFYGCCACIGAAGSGIIPRFAFLRSRGGFVLNFYEKGEIKTLTDGGCELTIKIDTEYPLEGSVRLTLSLEKEESFSLALRVPAWCKEASLFVSGEELCVSCGYNIIERKWRDGDEILLTVKMPVERVLPPEGAVNRELFAAYRRGPVVLAADKRVTDPERVLDVLCDENGFSDGERVFCPEIPECELCVSLPTADGERIRLINYSSAGKTWSRESLTAAWLYKKTPQ